MKSHHYKQGFSLIEVLVSLSIFTIVVTISVGTLVVMLDANAKAREKKELLSQLSFTLDTMTRDIRTGYNYRCSDTLSQLQINVDNPSGLDCVDGASGFAFNEAGGSLAATVGAINDRVGYRLDSNRIQRVVRGSSGYEDTYVTPDAITINDIRFYVTDTARDGDAYPPAVTITVDGSLPSHVGDDNEFVLQTTVTQRLLDL